MQLQIGESDCGTFTIAIATCLYNGDDPTIIRWDQSRMRQHLICCFESENMVPFVKVCPSNTMKMLYSLNVTVHKPYCRTADPQIYMSYI